MTPQQKFFDRWQFLAAGVARKLYRVVRRYGWEPDDCSQRALLLLWKLATKPDLWAMPENRVAAYLTVAVRRAVLVSARGDYRQRHLKDAVGYDQEFVEDAARHRRDHLAEFIFDVIDDAPTDVANYLSWRLGLTAERPKGGAALAERSAEFLLEQTRCVLR